MSVCLHCFTLTVKWCKYFTHIKPSSWSLDSSFLVCLVAYNPRSMSPIAFNGQTQLQSQLKCATSLCFLRMRCRYAVISRLKRRQAGYLCISVMTVRRSFLLVRFDVVQITGWLLHLGSFTGGGTDRKRQKKKNNSCLKLDLPLPPSTTYHITSHFGKEFDSLQEKPRVIIIVGRDAHVIPNCLWYHD